MTQKEIQQIVDIIFTFDDKPTPVVRRIALMDTTDRPLGGWLKEPLIKHICEKLKLDEKAQE